MLANLIFAQQEMPDFPGELDAAAGAAIGGLMMLLLIPFFIMLAIAVVVAYLLYSCLDRVPAQHRKMEAWQAWLILIPVLNMVWAFFLFPKMARSYQSYFAEKGRSDVGDCGEKIGMWCAICWVVSFLGSFVPCLGMIVAPLAFLAWLVLLIIFLIKSLTLKGQIPVGTA
jgi:hypothetical protein